LAYSLYFLNGSNHADGRPPPLLSTHAGFNNPPAGPGPPGSNPAQYEGFFAAFDKWVEEVAVPLEAARRVLAPQTEVVLNEFCTFVDDWCDAASRVNGSCPDWHHPAAKGTRINRATLGWSASAAAYAYAFGRLAVQGAFKHVTMDQLVAGPWPDNFPSVASLDWQSGEPNAKYWVVRMLATELGAGAKQVYNTTTTVAAGGTRATADVDGNATGSGAAGLFAVAMDVQGVRMLLCVSKTAEAQTIHIDNAGSALASVLEGTGSEPGFNPPVSRRTDAGGWLALGPYAVALVRIGL
jgi:hypothetical protein